MDRLDRRSVLAAGAAAVAGLAGCLGGDSASGLTLDTLEAPGSPGDTVPVLAEGRVTLLDFWATWCAPCRPQMAELDEVRERYDEAAVHMLGVTNEEDTAAIRSFWETYEGSWPVASDPALRTNDRFDVTRIPTKIVFDPAGEEVWRHVGLAAADTIVDAVEDART